MKGGEEGKYRYPISVCTSVSYLYVHFQCITNFVTQPHFPFPFFFFLFFFSSSLVRLLVVRRPRRFPIAHLSTPSPTLRPDNLVCASIHRPPPPPPLPPLLFPSSDLSRCHCEFLAPITPLCRRNKENKEQGSLHHLLRLSQPSSRISEVSATTVRCPGLSSRVFVSRLSSSSPSLLISFLGTQRVGPSDHPPLI